MAVTSNVCSNCALLLPSLVTHVHSSGQCVSFQAPALIMGSIENVMPSFMMPLACNDSPVRLLHVTQPHYSTRKTCQGMTPEQPVASEHKLYFPICFKTDMLWHSETTQRAPAAEADTDGQRLCALLQPSAVVTWVTDKQDSVPCCERNGECWARNGTGLRCRAHSRSSPLRTCTYG